MSIGVWKPLWLGVEPRCLYAALHRPPAAVASMAVVIVPPLLHEQPRSRRFVAEVASGLAALGLPCLRFDFFGTGDSSGNGDQADFASMRHDLDLAVATLRSHVGVERVALLAWRGAALPVSTWLDEDNQVDLVVLWEPIAAGAHWLAELERDDAGERASRPWLRPGLRRTATADDGQLMGCAASPQLRKDLAGARLGTAWAQRITTWAIVRPDATALPLESARVLALPAGSPTFSTGANMEATFFLSPPLEKVVEELGRALLVSHLLPELQFP